MLKKLFGFGKEEKTPNKETKKNDLRQKLMSLLEAGKIADLSRIIEIISKVQSDKLTSINRDEDNMRQKVHSALREEARSPSNLSILDRLNLKNYYGYRKQVYEPAIEKLQAAIKLIKTLQEALRKMAAISANAIRLEAIKKKTQRGVKANQPGAADRLSEIEAQLSENNKKRAAAEAEIEAAISSADFSNFAPEDILAAIKEPQSDSTA